MDLGIPKKVHEMEQVLKEIEKKKSWEITEEQELFLDDVFKLNEQLPDQVFKDKEGNMVCVYNQKCKFSP